MSVQVKKLLIGNIVLIVSIHPMCRFKIILGAISGYLNRFQYILCVGSRKDCAMNMLDFE